MLASLALAGNAVAGAKTAAPAAPPQAQTQSQPHPQAQAAPRLAVPQPQALIVMIRSSLMALHHANMTGNYTVLHALASESFQRANTPAVIGQAFAPLTQAGLDLSQVLLLTPQLLNAPAIDANGILQLSGVFPSQPKQIRFNLAYQAEARGWRLYGLAVTPVEVAQSEKPSGPAKPAP
jgi:hypothetical protein